MTLIGDNKKCKSAFLTSKDYYSKGISVSNIAFSNMDYIDVNWTLTHSCFKVYKTHSLPCDSVASPA